MLSLSATILKYQAELSTKRPGFLISCHMEINIICHAQRTLQISVALLAVHTLFCLHPLHVTYRKYSIAFQLDQRGLAPTNAEA
jgi:hypothetical protein